MLTEWTAEQKALLRKFAKGRAGARQVCAGPEKMFAPRFRSTLAGEGVVMPDCPDDGYLTRREAVAAAQAYRAQCRSALAQEKKE